MGEARKPLPPSSHPLVVLLRVDEGPAVRLASEHNGVGVIDSVVDHSERAIVGVAPFDQSDSGQEARWSKLSARARRERPGDIERRLFPLATQPGDPQSDNLIHISAVLCADHQGKKRDGDRHQD